MNSKSGFPLAFVLIVCSAIPLGIAAEANLKGIMQGLNEDVTAVVDGLLTDDFEKVATAANRIASHPRIPADQVQRVAAELGQEMATFKQFDMSVHDLALSMAAAAEAHDSGRLISDYQNMLANCLACHAAYKDRVAAVLAD